MITSSTKLRIAVIAALFLWLQSCTTLYNSLTPQVPAFEKGRAFSCNAALGSKGLDLAASYSPVNHFYFGANSTGMFRNRYHYYAAVAGHAGLYFPFKRSIIDVQGGYGFGNARWQNSGGQDFQLDYAAGDLTTGFGQAAWHINRNEHSAWGFGARFSSIRYHYTAATCISCGVRFDDMLASPVSYHELSLFCYYDEIHNSYRRVRIMAGVNVIPHIPSNTIETAVLGMSFYFGSKPKSGTN